MADMAEVADGDFPEALERSVAGSGRRLGDFELVEIIARGGMGMVWRARQVSLNREVALKLPGAHVAASPVLSRRFQIEAAAAAGLDHPNIVPIFDFGEAEGDPFLSMKLVEGAQPVSLAVRPAREAVRVLLQVVRAVQFAHERGVLHRDLKPGNILVDRMGHVWLTDFGLAKVLGSGSQLTMTRDIMGTPAYMAPEQCRAGTDLTISADVYGLGAVLYEMLTGAPPFGGEAPLEVMQRVQHEEPPPPAHDGVRVDAPPSLADGAGGRHRARAGGGGGGGVDLRPALAAGEQ